MRRIHLLAICGSLRAQSINAALLHAAERLAPADVGITHFHGIGALPLFNPDTEYPSPAQVLAFIEQLNAADGVLIASPEYAHGITGVMKNALDWVVGCEAFVNKPVAVINASPRASHADAALKETLSVMSATLVTPASIALPLLGARLDADGMVATPAIAQPLTNALVALRDHIVDTGHSVR